MELDMTNNNISDIKADMFLGLPMLVRLDLDHNKISVLKNGSFVGLDTLNH